MIVTWSHYTKPPNVQDIRGTVIDFGLSTGPTAINLSSSAFAKTMPPAHHCDLDGG